ncbi:MAG TPA: hypothetical protein VGK58_15300, partial [Lacipirellulaceae bacterium]
GLAAVRLVAVNESGAAAAIRLQHGVRRAKLTSICRSRLPRTALGGFAQLATLAGRSRRCYDDLVIARMQHTS